MSFKSTNDFGALAESWWDESGPLAPLHKMHPARMRILRNWLAPSSADAGQPLKGLKILDTGCGGGLVCESLARLGADVTGLDIDADLIATARAHAETQNLPISYICGDIHELISKGRLEPESFDAVLCLEVLEHLKTPRDFVRSCALCTRPAGDLIFSTLNRTVKARLLAVGLAEYVLGWLPRGTHDPAAFIKPHELESWATENGCTSRDIKGITFNPLTGLFEIKDYDVDINYLFCFRKK